MMVTEQSRYFSDALVLLVGDLDDSMAPRTLLKSSLATRTRPKLTISRLPRHTDITSNGLLLLLGSKVAGSAHCPALNPH